MEQFQTKQLADSQLEAFDDEFIDKRRRAKIQACIDRDFPSGEFEFLDLGGGNGVFADELLRLYPRARAMVADNSKLLLERNRENPRKETLLASVEEIERLTDRRFDVVFLNFVLHHLIGDGYAETRRNQTRGLEVARRMLTERGRVSIFENAFDGFLVDSAPSVLVYQLTASKLLAPIVSRLGANTAGVGVCYLSERQWRRTMEAAGLKVIDFSNDEGFEMSLARRVLLHLSYARRAHFWCAPER
jgi:ubiquinone/menaquinone biosynthesis C-methylase UbiE